ncbi:MAG: hypothetical protein H6862_02900 [Rhodospirillales bacterium]|nr:hypothetical protein [Rhodospirillales bacterium]
MNALEQVKNHLREGRVYRRADLEPWSNAIDRHLLQLQEEGVLVKLSGGLYYCPKMTAFGAAPAEDERLVEAFLKDRRFLLTSPNLYNALGLGTTQLYNETLVYNHKRHGRFTLGGRTFRFAMKPHFPAKPTPEFLLVDVVNNLVQLAEDREKVLKQVERKAHSMKRRSLEKAVRDYGGARAKKFFSKILSADTMQYA